MGKIGKISTIKKEYNNSQLQTMQGGLAIKGYTRIPGTGVFKYPYKELDGQYRTGLDPKAAYIRRISDPLEREMEIERVTELKQKLEKYDEQRISTIISQGAAPYEIDYLGEHNVMYKFYVLLNDSYLREVSEHYLNFRN